MVRHTPIGVRHRRVTVDTPRAFRILSNITVRASSRNTVSVPTWTPAQIRNLGIVAHVDAGKTTATERILHCAGAIGRVGEVEDGTTFTDWMTQEQERGISITAAATTLQWRGHLIHLVDTPGHVDFAMEVERSLRVLDGAVALFCAVEGVQPQSEAVWHQANRIGLPRVAFINKCDRTGANIANAVSQIRERLGANPVLVQHPIRNADGEFIGVVDLVALRGYLANGETLPKLSKELQQAVNAAREMMLESISEHDDELLEQYLGGNASHELITAALRRTTLAGRIVPTLLGAAKRYIGIEPLLNAIVDVLPSAADVRAANTAVGPAVVAQVFKLMRTSMGRLAFLRVYRGTVKTGDRVVNSRTGNDVLVEGLVRMNSNTTEIVQELSEGMIGAMIGGAVATGDTLYPAGLRYEMPAISIPPAVIALAIEAERPEDQPRLTAAIAAIVDEDPSLRTGIDHETGRTLIYGLGELHLEIAVDRIRREFQVPCASGRAAVAYRETIGAAASATVTVQRPAGVRAEFAEVTIKVQPRPVGQGVQLSMSAPLSDIPAEFRAAVESGVVEALERGVIASHPTTDIEVDVAGGAHHAVESCNAAYKTAAFKATAQALAEAQPELLEPIMFVEVVTPDDCLGEVIADLHARRGKITGITARPGVQTCACFVPMASMFGYSTDLRSKTRGRATCSLRFDHYQPVPKQIRDDFSSPRN